MTLGDPIAIEAELCKRSYADFFRAAWPIHEASTPLVWSWSADAVCAHLQALVEDWAKRREDSRFTQRLRDLLCTLPPGCLKSRLLAYLVAWIWTRWPHLRATFLSANPRVALRDSMLCRDVIASPWYQRTFAPTWQVRDDSDSKGLFTNTHGGWRSAMGLDARIVGERGDLLAVDDPHDPEEVESDAQREHVHDRWDNSISNRLNDLGVSIRVGIAQRTHEDDWSARRIAEGWTHLDLPMLYEPERACETPLGKPDPRTEEGECLDPVRFPPAVIAAERGKPGGERRFATLYQGRPAPKGGSMVKVEHLRFWRDEDKPDGAISRPKGCSTAPAVVLPKSFSQVVIAADLAAGKKTKAGDFNAIVAIGQWRSDFFLLRVWRERADFPEVQRVFCDFAKQWPQARKVVERAAAGGSLVTSLRDRVSGLIDVPPLGTKVQRLQAVLQFFEAGNVHFDERWTWLEGAIAELTTFPNSRFDDFTDAMSLGLGQCAHQTAARSTRVAAAPIVFTRGPAHTDYCMCPQCRDRGDRP